MESSILPLMFWLLACTGPAAESGDDGVVETGSVDSADSWVDTGHAPLVCGEVRPPVAVPTHPAVEVSGEVSWTLTFDEAARANGNVDCGYRRTYQGLQSLDLPWTCPDCEVITRGPATIVEGLDCVGQIVSADEVRTEQWGWNAQGEFFRANSENGTMGLLDGAQGHLFDYDQGTASLSWQGESTLRAGGTVLIEAHGGMTFATGEALVAGLFEAPRTEDYAAGWPRADPGSLTLDWSPELGDTLPNFRLQDQCGDTLDLWDLYGTVTVIEVSQYNCGPCQEMARTAAAWQHKMEGKGIAVQFVTTHGNGLGDSYGTPELSLLQSWVQSFGNHGPVVADRGWGIAMARSLVEDYSLSFPAWFIVDEEFTIIHAQKGFSDWSPAEEVLLSK